MDLLGDNPPIDMEAWGLRTNMEHRGIRDAQPALLFEDAKVHNSLIYNGCVVEGTVKNSVLFPGVHVGKGAIVENSVLFFNNDIGENCKLNKVITDVNSGFGQGVCVGPEIGTDAEKVTVIGWNNHIPDWTHIGEGATIYPNLHTEQWPLEVKSGEVLR